ncbi:DUF2752 domain-containing protein [Luteolibacter ambystomatis]|uniref:DUF2752 domain-containing protein n=1 Tax=Luteolibacter ambystomatis TaxID=2824561 RepID=A0A975J0L2_9BACT|nr:DUF2752 domain-containing protein [Luteolibacter ambystomatis]QUE51812.1 DUF2752 domain-containing protein [Luteolibacter ambystomatis]
MNTSPAPESRWAVASYLIRERKLGLAMTLGGAAYGLTALLGWHWFRCPFKSVTGHACPGCGLTRATLAMLRGDWAAMVKFHPLAPVFTLFWIAVGIGLACPPPWRTAYIRRLEKFEHLTRWPLWIGLALLGYSLTRWLGFCYEC